MKAAIITLHAVYNYGTQLQAFATQEKLKEYFDEVTLIDYQRPDTRGIKLIKTFTKGNPLKAFAILPTILYWKKVFPKFQNKYLTLTSDTYLGNDSFDNFKDIADIYFVGSDQVWNSGWNNGIIPPLYLSFVPQEKPKYAYASSFGRNQLNTEEVQQSKKYIDEFNYITVREASGVDILKKQYSYNKVMRIVDPTLALPANFWRKYSSIPKIKEDYILIYNLNRSKEFDEYAKKLAQKANLKLYRFCTRFDQIFRSGKPLIIPDITDFITLIDNAKYVITDSFHATAFSLNLNTAPICIYPNDYSNRISEFLNLLNLEDRHVSDYNDFSILNKEIDFNKVNKILDMERIKIDEYLTMIVNENN